jgi:drug/metabolite transporter (DMT)-like permease
VRDWGASRAGLYALISPIIALGYGWALFDEAVGWQETAGAIIMLIATGLAIGTELPSADARRCRTDRRHHAAK